MRIADLRKFLEKFDGNVEIRIKGFPPKMDSVELRYDITVDAVFMVPAMRAESVFIEADV